MAGRSAVLQPPEDLLICGTEGILGDFIGGDPSDPAMLQQLRFAGDYGGVKQRKVDSEIRIDMGNLHEDAAD